MYTLLIVEDEKMIRQGIKAMALRSGVAFSQVIECRNGEEGLEALRQGNIDLMITDIRMPKMDGIELIHIAKEGGLLPLTIVISGYDDFSYAVELLRAGVRDYILKPVERTKLTAILEKMASELEQQAIARSNDQQLSLNQLKYLLVSRDASPAETDAIYGRFTAQYGDEPYTLLVCNQVPESLPEGSILLENVNGQTVICEKCPSQVDYAGQSLVHTTIRSIQTAYKQALEARMAAFAQEHRGVTVFKPIEYALQIPKSLPEKQAQAISAEDFTPILNEWEYIRQCLKAGQMDVSGLPSCVNELIGRLTSGYQSVVPISENALTPLRQPFNQNVFSDYLSLLLPFLNNYHNALAGQLGAQYNRQKIERAKVYVNKNFCKELNMAIVSNEVSMNYSLFSTLFKLYVGESFVSYIKHLRVERAKELLKDTDMLVSEIGRKVGYENDKHFLKLFKATCGISPGEYRAYARIKDDVK